MVAFVCVGPVRRSVRSSASSSPIRARRATAASSKSSDTTTRAPSRRSSKLDRERVDSLDEAGRAAVRLGPHADRPHLTPAAGARRPTPSATAAGQRVVSRARAVVEVLAQGAGRSARTRCRSPSASTSGRRSSSCTWRRGDLGRVIGRQGRTAAALRTLASPPAEMEGKTGDARNPRSVGRCSRRMSRRDGRHGRWSAAIARAHGIRGQVIVNPETDFPEERFRRRRRAVRRAGGTVERADGSRRCGFSRGGRSSGSTASRR